MDVIEKRSVAKKILDGIRGKQIMLVVNETVLRELHRVRKWSVDVVVSKLDAIFGKKFGVIYDTPKGLWAHATKIKDRYALAHDGDVHILAHCRIDGYALLTRDGNMRRIASMEGVLAFHPKHVHRI